MSGMRFIITFADDLDSTLGSNVTRISRMNMLTTHDRLPSRSSLPAYNLMPSEYITLSILASASSHKRELSDKGDSINPPEKCLSI